MQLEHKIILAYDHDNDISERHKYFVAVFFIVEAKFIEMRIV